jgi:large-conductance mechanosensitive channel
MGAESQILPLALAVYIGFALMGFFTAITRDLVLPILSPLVSTEAGIAKWYVQIGSVKLNIGDVIVQMLNILIVFFVVSFTLPFIREYIPVAGRR